MAGWCDTYRGMVYPWQCDHQGHLTTMHYLGMFDQAGWHLLNRHGLGPEALADAGRGYVDAKDTIEYVAELRVGALVEVQSAFSRIGTSSIGLVHRMRNAATLPSGPCRACVRCSRVPQRVAARGRGVKDPSRPPGTVPSAARR